MSRATRRIPRSGHSMASHLGFQVLLKDDQPPFGARKGRHESVLPTGRCPPAVAG
jgi:hypothetical protein